MPTENDSSKDQKYIACMFHIGEGHFDFVEETLCDYDIGQYIIAFESDPYDHFHIIFEGTEKIYTNFSKRLIEKFKLRGKSKEGKGRQYGKVKVIKDIDKMMSYTLKNEKYRTNMETDKIQELLEKSFVKKENESKKLFDRCLAKIIERFGQEDPRNNGLEYEWKEIYRKNIIQIVLEETKEDFYFTRSFIEKLLLIYLRKCSNSRQNIYELLYSK